MSFLAGIFASILEWFLQKLVDYGLAWWKTEQAEQNAASQAQADSKAINDAQNTKDQTDATTKAAQNAFGNGGT